VRADFGYTKVSGFQPVTMPQGQIVFSRTPLLANSAATLRESWMTAALAPE
jgi:hypothetical protein